MDNIALFLNGKKEEVEEILATGFKLVEPNGDESVKQWVLEEIKFK